MDVLYLDEHKTCADYAKDDRPLIERKVIGEGDKWEFNVVADKLVFIMAGDISVSYDEISNKKVGKGKIILLPMGCKAYFYAIQKTFLIIIRLSHQNNFCEKFSYRQLLKYKRDVILNAVDLLSSKPGKEPDKGYSLDMNNCIWVYVNNLDARLRDGLRCTGYFEVKIKELFFLFSSYYTKNELLDFFEPLMHHDQEFSNMVLNNYHKAKNIKDLADLTNYSISGFEKRFKKIFNESPGHWLKQKRSDSLYLEIKISDESFKSLSFRHGFSSISNFNNYCKLHYGKTPGQIRKLNT